MTDTSTIDANDGLWNIHTYIVPVKVDIMRVVGGSHKGRHLESPTGWMVRPTSDRTREAVFNILYSLGYPKSAEVLDLFAGTGALGIESLSRGAKSAIFVDESARACSLIRENLLSLGLDGTVIQQDAQIYLSSLSVPPDIIFADQPYEFDKWPMILSQIKSSLVVAESDREIFMEDRWRVLKSRSYGKTVITVLEPVVTK